MMKKIRKYILSLGLCASVIAGVALMKPVIKDEELRAQVVQEALDEMLDFNLYGNMVKAYPPPDYVRSLKAST